ncbi:response regulator [Paludibacterium sp. THUN1379]|uniref:response regulator transcription factor n=1 Tax=Paludibacterium sp. THUN1379 TaxID=3112107 RepID=UPI00308A7D40|nr:response regulator [Paludibacterium sp. THUN1379]
MQIATPPLPHVLLIDDDTELTSLLAEYLQQDGFRVSCRHDGESGLLQARYGRHDILVLDVMLPDSNGIQLLRQLRTEGVTLPVLMLTARGDDIDRILGLELGADDYVTKPCSPRELSARLKAILRRSQSAIETATASLAVGALRLTPAQRLASYADQPLRLTGIEYNLLEVLVRHAGRIVSRQNLSEWALGRSLEPFDRSIDVHISSIRHKLPLQQDGQSSIRTIRGMGYQLVVD